MADQVMCWGPECANLVEQKPTGRIRQYCAPRCRQRAFRRNGGKAPAAPYPPLLPTPLHQDTPAATVAVQSGRTRSGAKPRSAGKSSDPAGKARKERRDSVQPAGAGGDGHTPGKADAPAAPPEGAAGGDSGTPVTAAAPAPDPGSSDPTAADTGHAGSLAEAPGQGTELTVTIPVDSTLPPVKLVEHAMVLAYKTDLERIGHSDTRQGHQVIAMAEKLVSSAASPSAAANLSKELDRLMDELVKAAGAGATQDGFSVIRQRTLHKLGLVGAR